MWYPTPENPAFVPPVAVIGVISLGLPLLAWGLLAVAVPVVIHLVFRERPHKELFPAMRFLVRSHASATRAQWLRHILLLLARVAAIVLAVGVLGRLGCTRQGGPSRIPLASSATPASVIFCIDNSAGMGYRYQGRTRVQAAVDWARNLLEDRSEFGAGSQFALVCGTNSPGMGAWREDRGATARLLETIHPGAHGIPVDHLLRQAYGLAAAARHPRREVFVLTDLTETSWTTSPSPLPEGVTGLFILDVGQDENRNASIAWPEIPPHALPATVPLSIPVRVMAGDLPCEPVLEFKLDGKPRGRQAVGLIPSSGQTEAMLSLPGLEAGPHSLEIELQPGDALSCDNSRFAWLMCGSLPKVGMIETGPGNEVARMVRAMIAPPTLPACDQRYEVQWIPLDALLTRDLNEMTAVVMADVSGLNGLAWEKLKTYVNAGGLLVIIPGPSLSPEGYQAGQGLLPAVIESVVSCDPPLRPAASNLSHPYLLPFGDVTIDSINDRFAFRIVSLKQVLPQASVPLAFSNGSPALAELRTGKGRTVLLAFSMAAEWGQFGTQAGPTIVLLHRVLDTARPSLQNVARLPAGAPALRAAGDGFSPLVIRNQEGSESVLLPSSGRLYPLPADTPQLYFAAEKSDPRRVVLYYSVNVTESESQLGRLSADSLKSRFDNDLVRVLGPEDRLDVTGGDGPVRVNFAVPLGIVLILLLLIESSFSNRFYRARST